MFKFDEKYLRRMILSNPYISLEIGKIRFKYYGDFDEINKIYEDCKDNMYYIGNSDIDGAPVFEYNYKNVNEDTMLDFNKLNILLRKYKINSYTKREVNIEEKSLLTFLKFFMYSCEENQIKGASSQEIKRFISEYED